MFADLGVPEPDAHLLKAELVARLQIVIRSQGLTQVRVGEMLGVSQPDVSRILAGRFHEISVERLVNFLTRLGCAVDIVVKPAKKKAFAPIHLEPEQA